MYIYIYIYACEAIDQAIRAEKQKNEELQKQILALQAQMRQQAEVKNPEPKHVAFEAPPAPSRVEILLEQAMARITSMEESMKQSESKPVESLPKSNASTLEPALPAKQNKPEPAEPAEPTEQEMFGSDAASDTDSEEATITTPSGHTVPLLQLYLKSLRNMQCSFELGPKPYTGSLCWHVI